ncbi:MAG: hypothetical protein ACRC3J_07390 [Culicoidibacterales bacterium]
MNFKKNKLFLLVPCFIVIVLAVSFMTKVFAAPIPTSMSYKTDERVFASMDMSDYRQGYVSQITAETADTFQANFKKLPSDFNRMFFDFYRQELILASETMSYLYIEGELRVFNPEEDSWTETIFFTPNSRVAQQIIDIDFENEALNNFNGSQTRFQNIDTLESLVVPGSDFNAVQIDNLVYLYLELEDDSKQVQVVDIDSLTLVHTYEFPARETFGTIFPMGDTTLFMYGHELYQLNTDGSTVLLDDNYDLIDNISAVTYKTYLSHKATSVNYLLSNDTSLRLLQVNSDGSYEITDIPGLEFNPSSRFAVFATALNHSTQHIEVLAHGRYIESDANYSYHFIINEDGEVLTFTKWEEPSDSPLTIKNDLVIINRK